MRLLALMLLILAAPVSANGLDDLKNALRALPAPTSLQGTYEARQWREDLNKKERAPETVTAQVRIAEDADGLQLYWDAATLKRANEETRAGRQALGTDPLCALIAAASALRLEQTINYAPSLLKVLAIAELRGERSDTYQGKPARVLDIAVPEADPEDEKISMKENSRLLQVWLGEDHLPLAMTITRKVRARVMVFLSVESSSREEIGFGILANRLVLLKREEHGSTQGPGNSSRYHNSFVFLPAAAQ
jgi:hypothetical protein